MTSTATTAKLAGKALYLELVVNPELSEDEQRRYAGWQYKGTKQVIVFPAYVDDTGREYPSRILSRVVSEYSPRAQWEWVTNTRANPNGISESVSGGYSSVGSYTNSEWLTLTQREKDESHKFGLRLGIARESVNVRENEEGNYESLEAWVVRDNKPIAVEVTTNDLYELNTESKTPQAVIRRINKVRDSIASFPKKLYTS